MQGSTIHVHSDNMTVAQTLKLTDEFLGVCIWNLLMVAAMCNIHIQTSHVRGFENEVTDTLSQLREMKIDSGRFGNVR